MVAPTRTLLRSRRRSRSGAATRRSVRTKAQPATSVIAKQVSVGTETHPQSPLLLTPRISGIRVRAIRKVPR